MRINHLLTNAALGIAFLLMGERSAGQHSVLDVDHWERPELHETIDIRDPSATPLDSLLLRLSWGWRFEETGKMYWIGYTGLMYAIAAHRDSAIGPLMALIESGATRHAKIGAIYSLYLTGLKGQGRFHDEFADSNIRSVLLSLLKYPEWRPLIMGLLIRDPWRSDVPMLFTMIMGTDGDYWEIIGGLMHYNLENPPLDQAVPEKLSHLYIHLKPAEFNIEGQMHAALDSLIALRSDQIEVEPSLFHQELCGECNLDPNGRDIQVSAYLKEITIRSDNFGFDDLGTRVHYYVEGGKVYICSAATAKKRWIEWWLGHTPESDEKLGR